MSGHIENGALITVSNIVAHPDTYTGTGTGTGTGNYSYRLKLIELLNL